MDSAWLRELNQLNKGREVKGSAEAGELGWKSGASCVLE